MKPKILSGLFFIFALLAFNSCCQKKGCSDADRVDSLFFENFDPAEMDTLVFTSYQRNGGFTARVDSFILVSFIPDSSRSREIRPHFAMEIQYDWKIRMSNSNTTFRINDFATKQHICNRCITGNSYYTSLESYSINDKRQNGARIEIRK